MNNFDNLKNRALIELKERLDEGIKNYNDTLLLENKEHINSIKKTETNEEYYIDSEEKIKFKHIKNIIITTYNKEYIRDSIIEYMKFDKCIFKNITFFNCYIYATYFKECMFDNVIFDNCKFINEGNEFVVFEDKNIFIKTKFKNCNLEKSIFIESDFVESKFEVTNLKNSILNKCNISNLHIVDCDMRSTKVINYKLQSISFEDEYLTKLNEDSFFDEINIKKDSTCNLDDIYKMYNDISIKFEANRLPNKSGEYYYLYKKLEYKTLKGIRKVKSYIYWMLCGYGEKPTYALVTSIEIVLFFTIMYMFTGLSIGSDVIDYDIQIIKNLPTNGVILDFLKSLYFSIVTFTTVGYGDITPIGLSVFLSGIEMFLGVTMVGIWTATLARKITR